ncbi:NlpC/P60 family protein, partial [Proteus mirabilis]
GIQLDDFIRPDEWWYTEQNLYLDNTDKQGFYQVEEAQEGDMILICLGTSKPCHAALYLGNQEILHHRPDRLSKRDTYGGYWFKYTHS